MRFFLSLLLIALLGFAISFYLPWWSIAIGGFLVALLIPLRAGLAFLAGFLALFILWAAVSFWLSASNNHILGHRISLLIIKSDNPVLLVLITGLIGGLVAGFASMTGSLLRKSR